MRKRPRRSMITPKTKETIKSVAKKVFQFLKNQPSGRIGKSRR